MLPSTRLLVLEDDPRAVHLLSRRVHRFGGPFQRPIASHSFLFLLSHPLLLIPPSRRLLSFRSMGKKRPSASAPEHAFRFDVVVGKTLEEDHLEFDLVILDGLDGNVCFGPEHVEVRGEREGKEKGG